MLAQKLIDVIAAELGVAPRQVHAALTLYDEGSTVPFVARYRKEATGGLDEVQLRDIAERSAYLGELESRRAVILASIAEQGRLDDALKSKILAAATKQALEDLYLPYRPKRRTRAAIARERGLEPLAQLIAGGAADDAAVDAAAPIYVNPDSGVATADDALRGARDVLAEGVAEDAELRALVRDRTRREGMVVARAKAGVDPATSKFRDYLEFTQKLADLPSHRVLALRRGEAESALTWTIEAPVEDLVASLGRRVVAGRAAVRQLRLVAEDAYKRLLAPSIDVELRLELKQRADEDAIAIFGMNLEQLLLGAPAGERVVLGLDPGYRTGVKAAVVSRTGALLDTATLYLHQAERFGELVRALVVKHGVELVAIGNGTASRETDAAVRKVTAALPAAARPQVVVVNEAGASVYSASDVAREEFPDLDVSLRGAPSIARRLQDPLAELVKIDPQSIGVGQYQHDVNQPRLKKRLDDVVESCVNRVGVEVNTASVPLLSYVAGVGPAVARNIVARRDAQGGFRSRRELLDVPRLGARAFEQAAGFLRVRGGAHPLDATAVHPERYGLVAQMAADAGVKLGDLVANDALLDSIDLRRYVSADVGMPTLTDIIGELRRPGRDPRSSFELPAFRDDVHEVKDLQPGMQLEGVVTNLVAFGAFVDVGVHQDGLVHVSQLADRFVRDPADVVRVGQKVRVTVLSVDAARNRIGLSMKKQPAPASVGAAAATAGGGGASSDAASSAAGRAARGSRDQKKAGAAEAGTATGAAGIRRTERHALPLTRVPSTSHACLIAHTNRAFHSRGRRRNPMTSTAARAVSSGAILLVAAGMAACGGTDAGADAAAGRTAVDTAAAVEPAAAPAASAAPSTPAAAGPDRPVGPTSGLAPNELGEIMVLEYHRLGETEGEWVRRPENFRRDLESLYQRGYRPVLMRDVVRGHIDVPAGTTPVVFTIDDSSRGQFYLLDDGSIDPNTMMGMWDRFAREHPAWHYGAVWCILPGADHPSNFFGERPSREVPRAERENRIRRKMEHIVEARHEACNHTMWHARLDQYGDEFVQDQIGSGQDSIAAYLPADYEIVTFALPLGMWPKTRALAWQGTYRDGRTYRNAAVLEVTGGPNPSPFDTRFDPRSIKRLIVAPNALERQLDAYDRNPERRFVSDGDPATVTVPAALRERVDRTRLGGRELRMRDDG